MSKQLAIIGLLAAVATILVTYTIATNIFVERSATAMQARLSLARQSVLSHLSTFEQLPSVLALDSRVIRLLAPLTSEEEAKTVSQYLEEVRARTSASEIFLMNQDGLTLAASNHDSVLSFVGRNYQFRPYFIDALQTGSGGMFAIGATTGVPGFFMAQRIRTAAHREGVIVVKIDLQRIVERWQSASEEFFIANSDNIIFLASNQKDLYRPLQPLQREALFRLQASRSYESVSANLKNPLVFDPPEALAKSYWIDDGRLLGAMPLGLHGWTIHTSTPRADLVVFVGTAAALVTFGIALLLASTVIMRQRRRYAQLQAAQTRQLEEKVEVRTRELRNEIEDRKRAEKNLRQTQTQLIEAAKLAALGKMSATIAHEVSQPLAALNTTLSSARLHANRGEAEPLEEKLNTASDMTARMHRMLKHLKSFARRGNAQPDMVNLSDSITAALAVLEPKTRATRTIVTNEIPNELCVLANDVQLQQVVVNLVSNAIDAAQDSEERNVRISAVRMSDTVILSVRDSGSGIDHSAQSDPFEPFATTKITGEGLGLGLAITREIVERYGGQISLANHPEGGALVTVSIPAVTQESAPSRNEVMA